MSDYTHSYRYIDVVMDQYNISSVSIAEDITVAIQVQHSNMADIVIRVAMI